ncbi:hypothetical protein BX600DRAFT_465029 [Xylariales sp. PMI_506]|nr:hypothetical protein BX600DRAFT_465029 [Xylariales sp. PMI_506]
MKRKSDDNPSTANGDSVESKKRQRLNGQENSSKRHKKDKKSKKGDNVHIEEDVVDLPMSEVEESTTAKIAEASDVAEKPTNKSQPLKDQNKAKKSKKSKNDDASPNKIPIPSDKAKAAPDAEEESGDKSSTKKNRFIVFVGNLPYSATVPDIEKHFSAVQPTSIRLLHEKSNPNKSRGIAFVEFAGFDHMKTCLKTLHHSTFTCQGRDHRGRPKVEERKINIELTAGGGGNTSNRKEKIKVKNEKLQGERERRAAAEELEKIKKEKERLAKGGQQKVDSEGVHPSRRGRVPGRNQ